MKLECSICGQEHDDPYGHNAEPINDGRCCAVCNFDIVLPTRIRLMFADRGKETAEMIVKQVKQRKLEE